MVGLTLVWPSWAGVVMSFDQCQLGLLSIESRLESVQIVDLCGSYNKLSCKAITRFDTMEKSVHFWMVEVVTGGDR